MFIFGEFGVLDFYRQFSEENVFWRVLVQVIKEDLEGGEDKGGLEKVDCLLEVVFFLNF